MVAGLHPISGHKGFCEQDEFYYMDTGKYFCMYLEMGNSGNLRPPEKVFPA